MVTGLVTLVGGLVALIRSGVSGGSRDVALTTDLVARVPNPITLVRSTIPLVADLVSLVALVVAHGRDLVALVTDPVARSRCLISDVTDSIPPIGHVVTFIGEFISTRPGTWRTGPSPRPIGPVAFVIG